MSEPTATSALVARLRTYAKEDFDDTKYLLASDAADCIVALETRVKQLEEALKWPPEVRRHNGMVDEIVGTGHFHLEQMSDGNWWFALYPIDNPNDDDKRLSADLHTRREVAIHCVVMEHPTDDGESCDGDCPKQYGEREKEEKRTARKLAANAHGEVGR